MSFDIDVRRRIGERTIAARFSAGPGLVALAGPSGVGKTSILNMVAGLVRPDEGHVAVGGRTLFDSAAGIDLPPAKRRLGYVFQDLRLFPHMTVRRNLAYGSRGNAVAGLEEAIGFLGIAPLLDRWPLSLSGGEAQRVAIGRALLSDPQLLLMDEPLSSLDPARRSEILPVIEDLRDRTGVPILYVTHDRKEAERLATQVVALRFD